MIKEIPILFSTPMVQAILDKRKTQTRRLVNPQPIWNVEEDGNLYEGNHKGYVKVDGHPKCKVQFASEFSKWQPGDLLYVREEHYRYGAWIEKEGEYTKGGRQKWMFVAHTDEVLYEPPVEFRKGRHNKYPYTAAWHKRLARFMPKSSARIWLQVESLRVERLQDISEEDAKAEGVQPNCEGIEKCPSQYCQRMGCQSIGEYYHYQHDLDDFPAFSAKESFESLWQSINGPESWNTNPWVWVVSFKVLSTTGKPESL